MKTSKHAGTPATSKGAAPCSGMVCKYVAEGLLTFRPCRRAGQCRGCPTEEAALAREEGC